MVKNKNMLNFLISYFSLSFCHQVPSLEEANVIELLWVLPDIFCAYKNKKLCVYNSLFYATNGSIAYMMSSAHLFYFFK